MRYIKKFNEVKAEKEKEQAIEFDSKSLIDDEQFPSFTTEVEDTEKVGKEFKKEMDKIEKDINKSIK